MEWSYCSHRLAKGSFSRFFLCLSLHRCLSQQQQQQGGGGVEEAEGGEWDACMAGTNECG